MHTVTSICLQLREHKQKATYEAVAKVLEIHPKMVMNGKPKNHLYSWIVSRETDKPLGYASLSAMDPELSKSKNKTIFDGAALENWLDAPENATTCSTEFRFLLEKIAY